MGYLPIHERQDSPMTVDFEGAVRRILRPLVRAMIARGLTYPRLIEILKMLYVQEAADHFSLDGKRVTDSRVSLLTGLQRRDIRAHRDGPREEERPKGMGPIPRVLALWRSDARFQGADGGPAPLPRQGEGEGPSLEALIREVGRDVHPRTILDEMIRLGLARLDAETDLVTLERESLVPSKDEAMLVAYYASNLGDHAEAASANLIAAPEPGPFFERAVHYNKLTPEAAARLEAEARARQLALLEELNAKALDAQRASRGEADAIERFRVGAFVYRTSRGGEGE